MSLEENKAFVRRFVEEVLNRGKLDLIPVFVAVDCVEHIPIIGQGAGCEGMKQAYATLLGAFPNLHYTIEDMVAEGDKVAWRWTMRGTHKGVYLGLPPTEREVVAHGASFERIAGDKIIERWAIMPEAEVLRQIGAFH
ncbi:MAG TPA: ester cyclase [Candidatus Acidoferrales bacterium]|nr:ester cyclase [Candidatus Acidoferrales bacterium]